MKKIKHKFIAGGVENVYIHHDGDIEIVIHHDDYCYLSKADTIAIAKAQGVTAEDLE